MNRSLGIAGVLALAAVALPAPIAAAEIEVSLEWMGTPPVAPVAAALVAEPWDGPAGDLSLRRWEVPGFGPMVIDLAAGGWYLWAEAPGFWGEELAIERAAATSRARLRMFPVGVVEGGLTPSEGAPDALEVGFRATSAGEEVAGVVDCPVVEARWLCELPAGQLDLVVRSGLFVPRRISGVSVAAGGRRELGDLELRLGGAVTGRVELEGGAPPSADCRALLRPEPAAAGAGAVVMEEPVSADGWFDLDGAPPGAYRVSVEEPGYLPATSEPVRVAAGVRVELEEPLRLALAARLDLSFEPQLDPYGEPWSFTLTALGPARESRAERAGADGRWSAEILAPGRYELRPAGRIDPTWFSQEIALESGGSVVVVESPIVGVEGWLTLGGEPLAAMLLLADPRDAQRKLRLQSDGAGYLTGLLPRAGTWDARVEAPREGLSRRLPAIEIVADGDGRATLTLDLPGTRLAGQVNDHLGRPVAGAVVKVRGRSSRQVMRIIADEEGRFLVRGLPAEPVSVRAEGPGARPTAWFEVSLEPGATAPPLQLVLLPRP